MSSTPICLKNSSTPNAFCHNIKVLAFIATGIIVAAPADLPPEQTAHALEGTHYFDAVLKMTGGNPSFSPADSDFSPFLKDSTIDGVLAFDVLRELAIDLDYEGQKLYLRHEK